MAEANVNTPMLGYDDMAQRWRLLDALWGGTISMKDHSDEYLPQYEGEPNDVYAVRKASSALFNAYHKTIQVLASEPFKRPVQIMGASEADEQLARDVDGTGTDLNVFGYAMAEDMLRFGKCHIAVRFPNTETMAADRGRRLSLRDQEELQIRPYLQRIDPRAAIGARGERRGGQEMLSRARVRETRIIPDGAWGEKAINLVRVYYPHGTEVYQEPERASEEWTLLERTTNTLGQIPIVTEYVERQGLWLAHPPLEDLGWFNLLRYQSDSDQHNILHYARIYLLAFLGFSSQEIGTVDVGVTKAIHSTNPQAHVDVVEHGGHAIEAGRKHAQDITEAMRAMGVDVLVPRVSGETATARHIDKAETVSQMHVITRSVSNALVEAFRIAAQWEQRDIDPNFDIPLNEDFSPYGLMGDPLKSIERDYELGLLSPYRYLAERKRFGLYLDSFDVNRELADAETTNPFALSLGATPLDELDDVDE